MQINKPIQPNLPNAFQKISFTKLQQTNCVTTAVLILGVKRLRKRNSGSPDRVSATDPGDVRRVPESSINHSITQGQ